MKKLLWLLAALVILFPSKASVELGTLRPVELVYVHREEGSLWIETDTEDRGKGRTLTEALEDLKETSQGEIFLDTADNLLVSSDALDMLPELSGRIRPAARLAIAEEAGDLQEMGSWLRTHPPECMLREAGIRQLPVITVTEGRYGFEKK